VEKKIEVTFRIASLTRSLKRRKTTNFVAGFTVIPGLLIVRGLEKNIEFASGIASSAVFQVD
jgi:hypothetical protein